MRGRRAFLAGLLAVGLAPRPTWADAGNPRFLSAARRADGQYRLLGLSALGDIVFDLPLPGRGHAAAAHPTAPLAVAFARRPGTFALVIDCAARNVRTQLEAPRGHHFSGHGAFSADGTVLFTGENDFDNGRGVIGVWEVSDNYARIASFPSGGVGPHDIRLMADGKTLVVANGGIETHPSSGRTKLNLATMRPNLSYVSTEGEIAEVIEPPTPIHKNSLRHLALGPHGTVAVACQWQGDVGRSPGLLAIHRRGHPLVFSTGVPDLEKRLRGYAGSVAMSATGDIAVTSPRGGLAVIFDQNAQPLRQITAPDICGVAANGDAHVFTTGTGRIFTDGAPGWSHQLAFDNHLIPIG